MKLGGILGSLLLAACGGASSAPPASVTTSNAASMPAEAAPAAAPTKADTANAADAPVTARELASESDAALPKIEFTPAGELKTNNRAKLESALKSIKTQTTASGAAAALTRSLGKPNWIEDDSKRVWVATDATQCVRLVLEGDGASSLEKIRFTESKTVSSKARQNLCTGQIERDE